MKFFTPPFSFIASHPLHENAAVIIDRDGNLVAAMLMPTVAPEDLEEASQEITRIGVAMAEAVK